MIIVTNVFTTKPGKVGAGLEWAKRLMATSKKAGTRASKGWLLRRATGDTNRFALVGEFASMAEYETIRSKRLANPELKALREETADAGWYVGIDVTISEVVEEY